MNERMKDLVGQAKFMAEESINKKISANAELNAFAEKFAELMVKEFETVAKQPPHYYDAPSCGWRNPINYVCKSVKEHFGVEA
jgi:hypothetical protein